MPRVLLPIAFALWLGLIAACQSDAEDDTQAGVAPSHRGVQRCQGCGRIESKREVLPGAAGPGSVGTYEYTLRMPDGSSRVFLETPPATWRVGERVGVIDRTLD